MPRRCLLLAGLWLASCTLVTHERVPCPVPAPPADLRKQDLTYWLRSAHTLTAGGERLHASPTEDLAMPGCLHLGLDAMVDAAAVAAAVTGSLRATGWFDNVEPALSQPEANCVITFQVIDCQPDVGWLMLSLVTLKLVPLCTTAQLVVDVELRPRGGAPRTLRVEDRFSLTHGSLLLLASPLLVPLGGSAREQFPEHAALLASRIAEAWSRP